MRQEKEASVSQNILDDPKVEWIREQMPVTRRSVYLNTGTAGPLPRPAVAAMQAAMERELFQGRSGTAAMQALEEHGAAARTGVAAILGASPTEIALTHFTTEGINVGVWSLDWQPGDEVITSNLEHPAVWVPLQVVSERRGVVVRTVDLGLGDGDVLGQIATAITPRTRMIVLSHVTYATGAVLPVAGLARLTRERGIRLLIDGAQAAGAIPVDVKAIGAELYAVPGQKWLCGPEDTGALYVDAARMTEILLTFAGYKSVTPPNPSEPRRLRTDARRYEVGSRFVPALAAQAAALRWLREEVGLEWIFARIQALAQYVREGLGTLRRVRVLTPVAKDTYAAGLVSFAVDDVAAPDLVQELDRRGYYLRWIDQPRCCRISCGFYNTTKEIDGLIQEIERIRRGR